MDSRLVIIIFVAAVVAFFGADLLLSPGLNNTDDAMVSRATDRTLDRVDQSGAKKRMHEAIDGFGDSDREESSRANDGPEAN
jgi:hypothetical protein